MDKIELFKPSTNQDSLSNTIKTLSFAFLPFEKQSRKFKELVYLFLGLVCFFTEIQPVFSIGYNGGVLLVQNSLFYLLSLITFSQLNFAVFE